LSQHKFSTELKTREGISYTKTKHGANWIEIALKSDWVTVCNELSPLSLAAIGDRLGRNAESIEKSSIRENFPHLTPNPSPHSDPNPSPIKKDLLSEEGKDEEANEQETSKQNKHSNSDEHEDRSSQKSNDPGLQKFKAGMAKRQCCLCSRTFPYDLTPYVGGGKRGYICVTCHMTGPPPEPAKADSQAKLEEGQ
jgi:hypothetical protein